VFDLDFGKKYKKGKVVVNEREIKLESIEDLYKVLT
jgi:repressor of nif and glnA expression